MAVFDGSPTPDEIAVRAFSTVRRGLDPHEVRSFLESVARDKRNHQAQLEQLQGRVQELEHEAAHPKLDEATIIRALGEETASLLSNAKDAARSITSKAEDEANATRGAADAEALETRRRLDQERAETEEHVTALRRSAQEESAGLRDAAIAEAAKMREAATDAKTKAEQNARDALAEAHAEATALRRQADEDTKGLRKAAQDDADKTRAEAAEEANQQLVAARADADRIRAEAGDVLTQRTQEANAEAERIRKVAQDEAMQIKHEAHEQAEFTRSQATEQARTIVGEAQQQRERILSDLTRRRRTGQMQIEQLRVGRGRLLEAYDLVRRNLDEVSRELHVVEEEARAEAERVAREYEPVRDTDHPELDTMEIPTVAPGDRDEAERKPKLADSPAVREEEHRLARLKLRHPDDKNDATPHQGLPVLEPPSGEEGVRVIPSAVADSSLPPEEGERITTESDADAHTPDSIPTDAPGAGLAPLTADEPTDMVSEEAVTEEEVNVAPAAADAGDDDPSAAELPAPDDHTPDDHTPDDHTPDDDAAAATDSGSGSGSDDDLGDGKDRGNGEERGVAQAGGPGPVAADQVEPAGPVEGAADEPTVAMPAIDADVPAPRHDVAGTPAGAGTDTPSTAQSPVEEPETAEHPGVHDGSGGVRIAALQVGRPGVDRSGEIPRITPPAVPGPGPGGAGDHTPAGSSGGADHGTAGDRDDVDSLFARIRAEGPPAGDDEPTVAGAEVEDDESPSPTRRGPDGSLLDPADEVALQVRDAAMAPLDELIGRRMKRVLQDLQNSVLNRMKGRRPTVAAVVGERHAMFDPLAEAIAPVLADAAVAGARLAAPKRRSKAAIKTDDLVDEVCAAVIGAIRTRVEKTLAGARSFDDAGVAAQINAIFRDWRGERINRLGGDAVATAFARGAYVATPTGMLLRWVPDDGGQHCADCDDNALAGPTKRGETYPTGQRHPPAHSGCRCWLVRVEQPAKSGR